MSKILFENAVIMSEGPRYEGWLLTDGELK